jgi:hypothetical protein
MADLIAERARAGCGRRLGVPFLLELDVLDHGVEIYECVFGPIDQNDPNLIRLVPRRPPCP